MNHNRLHFDSTARRFLRQRPAAAENFVNGWPHAVYFVSVTMRAGCLVGFFVTALIYSSSSLHAAQPEETLLEEINRLPEAERQARLVSGAKKEGSVTWYVAMNRAYAQDLINVFQAEHPFLKVNALTAMGGGVLIRVLSELWAQYQKRGFFNT